MKPILLIAAYNRGGYIGHNGKLLYQFKADLKHFKEATEDHLLIMGRKTFESLPRMLPGREHHVITRNASTVKLPRMSEGDSVEYHLSFDQALAACREIAEADDSIKGIAVIGGEEVFERGLRIANVLQLTAVEDSTVGDARFPTATLAAMEVAPGVTMTTEWFSYQREQGIDYKISRIKVERSALALVDSTGAPAVRALGRRHIEIRGETYRCLAIDRVYPIGEFILAVAVGGSTEKYRFETTRQRNIVQDEVQRILANAE